MATSDSDSPLLGNGDSSEKHPQQAHRNKGASKLSTVFNLSTTIVGAGIMSLPATMRIVGVVPCFLLIVAVAILSEKSMDFLVKQTKAAGAVTYGGAMGHAFGRPGRVAAEIAIIINSFGTLVVYLIIIADVLSGSTSSSVHHTGVFEEWAGKTWWNRRSAVMVFTTVFLAPLLCLRRIDLLKIPSAVSVLLAVFFVLAIAIIGIVKMLDGDIGWPQFFPNFDDNGITPFTFFSVIPVMVIAFLCHHCAHPILHDLEAKADPRTVVQYALVLCTAIYLFTSLFGYLLFGTNTLKDVLSNFDEDLGIPYIADIIRVGYAVHLMFVFPLLHFSLRLNLDGFLFPQGRVLDNSIGRFVGLTGGTILLCPLAACFIPNIWDVFEVTGSTSAIVLCYIFPAILVLRDPNGIATRQARWMAIFMILLATASGTIALIRYIFFGAV